MLLGSSTKNQIHALVIAILVVAVLVVAILVIALAVIAVLVLAGAQVALLNCSSKQACVRVQAVSDGVAATASLTILTSGRAVVLL